MALTAKQKIFVKEYLKDKNAARAARAAGFSAKAAKEQASRLLTKANVRAAVDAGLVKLSQACDISAERTIKRIAEFAYDKKSIKPSDTLKACEMLGKHFKLFTDVTEVSGKDGGPQVIAFVPTNGSEAPGGDGSTN